MSPAARVLLALVLALVVGLAGRAAADGATAMTTRMSLSRFARALLPAQAVAMGTSSSLASLPAMIDGAERRLHLPSTITGVVLPLAVSSFKVTGPTIWLVAVGFLGQQRHR